MVRPAPNPYDGWGVYLLGSMVLLVKDLRSIMRSSLVIWFTMLVSVVRSQNLVPNGDFEQYSSCPALNSQMDRATPWFNAYVSVPWGPGPTPDYFNSCTTLAGIDVPSNNYGVQDPHSDSAYAGLAVYMQFSPDFREYVEVQLTQPLVAGSCYELSMYVSLAEKIGNTTASSDIGAYFSAMPLIQTIWDTLPVVPQLDHLGGLVADTINWVLVAGIYQAQGGEEYLTIGNFHSDAVTTTLPVDSPMTMGTSMTAYYFIDDVSLELVESPTGGGCGPLGIVTQAAGPTCWLSDPFGDELMIGAGSPGQVTLTIWDLSGKAVLVRKLDQPATLGIGHLAEGVYVFELVDRTGDAARGKFIKP